MSRDEPVLRLVGLLDTARKVGSGWEASCPGPRHARGDKRPSLTISTGLDGRALVNCHGGCTAEEVVGALGLTLADLFERTSAGYRVRRFRVVGQNGTGPMDHVRVDKPGDKDMWWERNGRKNLAGVPLASLPLYRAETLTTDARPVVVCEGEAKADALAEYVGETGPFVVGTVTGAGGVPCDESLSVLAGHEVWLWADNDVPGREHMHKIAARLPGATVRWVVWADAPEHGDAADWVAAGGDDLSTLVRTEEEPSSNRSSPRIWTARELAVQRFTPPKWAIPNLLPAGLAILAGRPKLGKSWLALGWAIDLAGGHLVLRRMEAPQGETLYLALEDGPRRIQERIHLMLGDASVPAGMHIATEWPRTNEGGIELLTEWLTAHPDARLVVIDTFKRVRPLEKGNARLYDLDYDAMQPLAALAMAFNVAIIVVFHTRKTESTDPLEMVSGTLGVSGAADCVQVLRRERGQADASLFVTGRDVEEQDLALRWDHDETLGWALLGDAAQFRMSKERAEILAVVGQVPGMKPTNIADALGKRTANVRYLLFRMVQDGEIRARDGTYFPVVLAPTANGANAAVMPNPITTLRPIRANSGASAIGGVSGVSDQGQNEGEDAIWR